ncbi:hypothetical protein EVAR_9131_1 [Eumeta japonica]|uniref:Uncharacterized protein n=1 Tax=Eumeta variegata TaxID=151549 RepID=A0A4C1TWA1_EUMVA|nr:hypothetical protein EVAR_9131_1 [Eumeta japonica]
MKTRVTKEHLLSHVLYFLRKVETPPQEFKIRHLKGFGDPTLPCRRLPTAVVADAIEYVTDNRYKQCMRVYTPMTVTNLYSLANYYSSTNYALTAVIAQWLNTLPSNLQSLREYVKLSVPEAIIALMTTSISTPEPRKASAEGLGPEPSVRDKCIVGGYASAVGSLKFDTTTTTTTTATTWHITRAK